MKEIRSYKDIVSIPENLKEKLPTSYDIVGSILLLKLDRELLDYKREIGDALLRKHKNVRTVCLVEPVSGEYRTRNLEIIAGENNTETVHKEYGLNFYLDVKKVYFSPRLANERLRIAKLVKDNEVIVDMFTGVAPFPIMIAKNSSPRIIYAIDKNKHAIEYARKNLTINKVLDKIELINEDSRNIKIIKEKYNERRIDRIIMNHPTRSFDFFKYALELVSNTIIHYYEILPDEKLEDRIKSLEKLAIERGIKLEDVKIKKIKSYSPREFYICFDISAKR